MIELVLLIGFVVPLALWQFYDLDKAKKETARKRQEALSKEVNTVESDGESVPTPGD